MRSVSWNEQGFFSGITEDYSVFRWFKGENENPYLNDEERPLAARFWEYEREFYLNYLDKVDATQNIASAYEQWKTELLNEHLPGNSPNPYGGRTNWTKTFETGRRIQ